MSKARSIEADQRYNDAKEQYQIAADQYAGNTGYSGAITQSAEGVKTSQQRATQGSARQTEQSFNAGQKYGGALNSAMNDVSRQNAKQLTAEGTTDALGNSNKMNANANAEAQKYANQQAKLTATNARNQTATAARSAGMNKARAAAMGGQQASTAYQNAMANAYGQQLQNASANQNTQLANYNQQQANQASQYQNNVLNQQNMQNQNYNTQMNQSNAQQQMAYGAGTDRLNAQGSMYSGDTQEAQNNYDRAYGDTAFWTGMLTSDERLKHYKECSKKVVCRTPSKYKALKWVKEEK